jgi:hypothetical protein
MFPILNTKHFWEESASYSGVSGDMFRQCSVSEVQRAKENFVANPQLYTYRWDRQGRKGQTCRVTARGKFNSIRVEFEDGYAMITSGNAIRKFATPTPSSERTAK